MDSTHIRRNTEFDSATRELRCLYLGFAAESSGYRANFWTKDERSDSVRLSGGNGFNGVQLVLTPHGNTLVGSATASGDASGVPPLYLGLVRADPVACGPLLHHRPADAGWSTDGDSIDTLHHAR